MARFIRFLALVMMICCLTGCDIFPLERGKPTQETKEAVSTAQAESSAPEIETESDHADKIEQIRSWYREIVTDADLDGKTYGDAATVYRKDGQIVSIAEYRLLSDSPESSSTTVHFYYRNEDPFFVFIQFENAEQDEVRLYFDRGELIRWVIDQDTPHDNQPNAQWQDYYTQALTALQSAKKAA